MYLYRGSFRQQQQQQQRQQQQRQQQQRQQQQHQQQQQLLLQERSHLRQHVFYQLSNETQNFKRGCLERRHYQGERTLLEAPNYHNEPLNYHNEPLNYHNEPPNYHNNPYYHNDYLNYPYNHPNYLYNHPNNPPNALPYTPGHCWNTRYYETIPRYQDFQLGCVRPITPRRSKKEVVKETSKLNSKNAECNNKNVLPKSLENPVIDVSKTNKVSNEGKYSQDTVIKSKYKENEFQKPVTDKNSEENVKNSVVKNSEKSENLHNTNSEILNKSEKSSEEKLKNSLKNKDTIKSSAGNSFEINKKIKIDENFEISAENKFEGFKNYDKNRLDLNESQDSLFLKDPTENGSRLQSVSLKDPTENGSRLQSVSLKDPTENGREALKNPTENGRKLLKDLTENGRKLLKDPTENGRKVLIDPTENGRKALKDPTENGRKVLNDPTENGRKALKDPTENERKVLKDPTENGRKALKDPTENGRKVLKDPTENGRKALKDPTENGRKALKDPTENGRKVLKDPTENGCELRDPTENGREALKDPTANGCELRDPTENGRELLKDPTENGREALKDSTENGRGVVEVSETHIHSYSKVSVNNTKVNTSTETYNKRIISSSEIYRKINIFSAAKNSDVLEEQQVKNKSKILKRKTGKGKNILRNLIRKRNNRVNLDSKARILKETFRSWIVESRDSSQDSDSLRDTVKRDSEILRDSMSLDSEGPKKTPVKSLRNPKARKMPYKSKTLTCYVCKEMVRKYRIAEHLYFGPLRCSECGLTMDYCDSFATMIKTMGTKGDLSCLHKSLKWSGNAVRFLKRKLRRDLIKRRSKSKPSMRSIVKSISVYVENLNYLEHRSPWRSAIRDLKRFIASEISAEDPKQTEDSRVENQAVKDKKKPVHKRRKSESKRKHRSERKHKNDRSKGLSDQKQSNCHRDKTMPSIAKSLMSSDPHLSRIETIPQTVEEEAVIPITEWKGDVLYVEGVTDRLEEVRISLSADEDGRTPPVLEEFHIVASGDPEIASLTVGELDITSEGDVKVPEIISEEMEALEAVPGQLAVDEGVDFKRVLSQEGKADLLMDKMELDITQVKLEEEKGVEPMKEPQNTNEIHYKKRNPKGKSCETEETKTYNLRKRKNRPVDGQEKKRLLNYLLPAASASHKHSLKEEGRQSLLNPKETNDELMEDTLFSQTYGLEHLDEATEYVSVSDHIASGSIISQDRDVIENSSLFLNRPGFIPPPDITQATPARGPPPSRSHIKSRSPKKKKTFKNTRTENSSSKCNLDRMVFGKDTIETPKYFVVHPPLDGHYYIIRYPSMPVPDACPMCYYRILPCMFSINLITNLATVRCCGCPLTIYIVQEPTDMSLPRIVFETKSRSSVLDKTYKPKPARYKKSNDPPNKLKLDLKRFVKT